MDEENIEHEERTRYEVKDVLTSTVLPLLVFESL